MKSDKIKTYVFISYARSDAAEVANLLQLRLEDYRIPRKLVGKGVPLPESKYLRRVFVDTEDLSVSSESFHGQLRQELGDAEYLIALCSKAAARSDSFVHKEIEYFTIKNGGDASHILPVALDGVCDDAIPEGLREIVKTRNIIIWNRGWPSQGRLGKAHLHSAFFKVLEFILGVDAGVLNNRYWITWRRKIVRAVCVGAAFMLAIADEKEVLAHYYVEKFEEELIKLLNENPAISDCSWKFKFVTDKDELKKAIDDISTGRVLNK